MDLSLIETLRWERETGFVRLERHLARLAQWQVGFAEGAMPWLHAGVLLCIAALFLFLARRRLAAS